MCQYHLLGFCKLSLSALNTEFNLLCCLCTSVLRKIISTKMKNIKTFEKLIKRISDRDRDRDIEGIGIKKNRNVSDGRTEKRKNETEIKMKGVQTTTYLCSNRCCSFSMAGGAMNTYFGFILYSSAIALTLLAPLISGRVRSGEVWMEQRIVSQECR